jgi:ribosomal protein S18 acetylase RimI-like enzyme
MASRPDAGARAINCLFMSPKENAAISPKEIFLRPASASDSEFLIQVYLSTRQAEMGSWGWSPAQQAAFVRMQYDARQRGYAAEYPSAETSIICAGGVPVGSMIIYRGNGEIRLVDISLLPEFRGRDIGGDLIGRLKSEAVRSKVPLKLSVLRDNPATHLYERLGFIIKGGDAMYSEMEWTPAQASGNIANLSLENDPHAGESE